MASLYSLYAYDVDEDLDISITGELLNRIPHTYAIVGMIPRPQ